MSESDKKREKELDAACDVLKHKQLPDFTDQVLLAILDELESLRWRLDSLEAE